MDDEELMRKEQARIQKQLGISSMKDALAAKKAPKELEISQVAVLAAKKAKEEASVTLPSEASSSPSSSIDRSKRRSVVDTSELLKRRKEMSSSSSPAPEDDEEKQRKKAEILKRLRDRDPRFSSETAPDSSSTPSSSTPSSPAPAAPAAPEDPKGAAAIAAEEALRAKERELARVAEEMVQREREMESMRAQALSVQQENERLRLIAEENERLRVLAEAEAARIKTEALSTSAAPPSVSVDELAGVLEEEKRRNSELKAELERQKREHQEEKDKRAELARMQEALLLKQQDQASLLQAQKDQAASLLAQEEALRAREAAILQQQQDQLAQLAALEDQKRQQEAAFEEQKRQQEASFEEQKRQQLAALEDQRRIQESSLLQQQQQQQQQQQADLDQARDSSSSRSAESENERYVDSKGVEPTEWERGVLKEINRLRTRPSGYVEDLVKARDWFSSDSPLLWTPPSLSLTFQTREGVSALDEAIKLLQALSPLPPLRLALGLSSAAQDFVREKAQGEEGKKGVGGAGGVSERVEKYGRWGRNVVELVSYGKMCADPSLLVLQWTIDDDSARRAQRAALLSPDFLVCGASFGPLPSSHAASLVLTHSFSPSSSSSSSPSSSSPSSSSAPEEKKDLREREDGSGWEIESGEIGQEEVARREEAVRLTKMDRDLVLTIKSTRGEESKTFSHRWTLPFQLPSSLISASLDPLSRRLVILLRKGLASSGSASGEESETLRREEMSASEGAEGNRVKVNIVQGADAFSFTVLPASVACSLAVQFSYARSVLCFESTYRENTAEGPTETTLKNSVKIPFAASPSLLSFPPSDPPGSFRLVIAKPSAQPAEEGREIDIPIRF